jgi:hypothetical protein
VSNQFILEYLIVRLQSGFTPWGVRISCQRLVGKDSPWSLEMLSCSGSCCPKRHASTSGQQGLIYLSFLAIVRRCYLLQIASIGAAPEHQNERKNRQKNA